MATDLIDVAEWKEAMRRMRAREEAERRVRAQREQEERDQALLDRIKAAHEAGEVYPLVLPPGAPEFLREHIQAQIIERG
jgi:hypothetical protein